MVAKICLTTRRRPASLQTRNTGTVNTEGHLARWALQLRELDFEVIYRAGPERVPLSDNERFQPDSKQEDQNRGQRLSPNSSGPRRGRRATNNNPALTAANVAAVAAAVGPTAVGAPGVGVTPTPTPTTPVGAPGTAGPGGWAAPSPPGSVTGPSAGSNTNGAAPQLPGTPPPASVNAGSRGLGPGGTGPHSATASVQGAVPPSSVNMGGRGAGQGGNGPTLPNPSAPGSIAGGVESLWSESTHLTSRSYPEDHRLVEGARLRRLHHMVSSRDIANMACSSPMINVLVGEGHLPVGTAIFVARNVLGHLALQPEGSVIQVYRAFQGMQWPTTRPCDRLVIELAGVWDHERAQSGPSPGGGGAPARLPHTPGPQVPRARGSPDQSFILDTPDSPDERGETHPRVHQRKRRGQSRKQSWKGGRALADAGRQSLLLRENPGHVELSEEGTPAERASAIAQLMALYHRPENKALEEGTCGPLSLAQLTDRLASRRGILNARVAEMQENWSGRAALQKFSAVAGPDALPPLEVFFQDSEEEDGREWAPRLLTVVIEMAPKPGSGPGPTRPTQDEAVPGEPCTGGLVYAEAGAGLARYQVLEGSTTGQMRLWGERGTTVLPAKETWAVLRAHEYEHPQIWDRNDDQRRHWAFVGRTQAAPQTVQLEPGKKFEYLERYVLAITSGPVVDEKELAAALYWFFMELKAGYFRAILGQTPTTPFSEAAFLEATSKVLKVRYKDGANEVASYVVSNIEVTIRASASFPDLIETAALDIIHNKTPHQFFRDTFACKPGNRTQRLFLTDMKSRWDMAGSYLDEDEAVNIIADKLWPDTFRRDVLTQLRKDRDRAHPGKVTVAAFVHMATKLSRERCDDNPLLSKFLNAKPSRGGGGYKRPQAPGGRPGRHQWAPAAVNHLGVSEDPAEGAPKESEESAPEPSRGPDVDRPDEQLGAWPGTPLQLYAFQNTAAVYTQAVVFNVAVEGSVRSERAASRLLATDQLPWYQSLDAHYQAHVVQQKKAGFTLEEMMDVKFCLGDKYKAEVGVDQFVPALRDMDWDKAPWKQMPCLIDPNRAGRPWWMDPAKESKAREHMKRLMREIHHPGADVPTAPFLCWNCGSRNHTYHWCVVDGPGNRCFTCDLFGHRSTDCPGTRGQFWVRGGPPAGGGARTQRRPGFLVGALPGARRGAGAAAAPPTAGEGASGRPLNGGLGSPLVGGNGGLRQVGENEEQTLEGGTQGGHRENRGEVGESAEHSDERGEPTQAQDRTVPSGDEHWRGDLLKRGEEPGAMGQGNPAGEGDAGEHAGGRIGANHSTTTDLYKGYWEHEEPGGPPVGEEPAGVRVHTLPSGNAIHPEARDFFECKRTKAMRYGPETRFTRPVVEGAEEGPPPEEPDERAGGQGGVEAGQWVWYSKEGKGVELARVASIHFDHAEGGEYYTVEVQTSRNRGTEVQTVRKHLQPWDGDNGPAKARKGDWDVGHSPGRPGRGAGQCPPALLRVGPAGRGRCRGRGGDVGSKTSEAQRPR